MKPWAATAMQEQQAGSLLQLCKHHSSKRTQQDIWHIRDRLHECSSFFRLWPAQLQQLLCRLLQVRQWVQNEVLAAAGSWSEELCFIVNGQAAVAVRANPGSSMLRDVAMLHAGDTFGELCLLGKQRHPAFVVVRSPILTGLTVNAQVLAKAMLDAAQQAPGSTCCPAISTASTAPERPAGGYHEPQEVLPATALQPDTASIDVDALYQLIGETRGQPRATLKPDQLLRVRQLHRQQLQEAVAAEAATVGAWQQLPHERHAPDSAPDSLVPDIAALAPQTGALQQQQQLEVTDVSAEGEATGKSCTVLAGGQLLHQLQPSRPCPPSRPQLAADKLPYQPRKTGGTTDVTAADGEQVNEAQQQQQEQQPVRTPLMHHAAIMHFATLKAVAAGAHT